MTWKVFLVCLPFVRPLKNNRTRLFVVTNYLYLLSQTVHCYKFAFICIIKFVFITFATVTHFLRDYFKGHLVVFVNDFEQYTININFINDQMYEMSISGVTCVSLLLFIGIYNYIWLIILLYHIHI